MPRIKAIEPERATGEAKQLLAAVNDKFGMVPNLARTLANSPAALKGYLALGEALEGSLLPAKLREQISHRLRSLAKESIVTKRVPFGEL